jgi:hypothetical protein
MLELDDPRWGELIGGYRVPYDPRPALVSLESGASEAWKLLWDELHHQGDVDTASYAAVPHIVRIYQARRIPDWNAYALVGTIELARGGSNPDVPSWLEPAYSDAVRSLAKTGSRELWESDERELVQCALALIALVRGHRLAGQLLLAYTEDELAEMVPE